MVKLPTFFYLPTRCNFVPDNLRNIGMSKMACFDLRVGHSPLVRGEIICSCHMPIGEKKNQNICARKCYSSWVIILWGMCLCFLSRHRINEVAQYFSPKQKKSMKPWEVNKTDQYP